MGNIKQKAAAKNLVLNSSAFAENRRFNALKDLLIASGYSKLNAERNSAAIISSKGVQEELVKLGFNVDAAEAVIAEILMNGEEQNRIKAAQEIFKIRGSYAPEKRVNINLVGEVLIDIENDDGGIVNETD